MNEGRVVVYTSNREWEVELLKKYLADHDIVSFSINKQDSLYHFGEIELYVDKDDIIRAKRLISKYKS